jgi:hypothetical protein
MAVKGIPVVISENGRGFPVKPVAEGAPLLTVAGNGIGTPVVINELGTPFVLDGMTPPTPMGPLDWVTMFDGDFTNFSKEYTLASDCCVVGLAARFSGDPVIEIKHGDDVLYIVREERSGDILGLIAIGRGLAIETANVTVTCTGGTLGGGAIRINEMVSSDPALSGWEGGGTGSGNPVSGTEVGAASGGVIKGVFVNAGYDRYHQDKVTGPTTVWDGFTSTGTAPSVDFSVNGPWSMDGNWTIVGDRFVHTGPGPGYLRMNFPATPIGTVSARAWADMADGARVVIQSSGGSADTYSGPGTWLCATGSNSVSATSMTVTAYGDVEIWDASLVYNSQAVAFTFFSAPAQTGDVFTYSMPYNPRWLWVAVEILGEDY